MTRIDAWVWAVRLAPSRSQAAAGVKAGHVRLNGDRAKPSQSVKVGDEVRVYNTHEKREHIVIVRELLTKRVGAAVAVTAYDDKTPPLPPKPERVLTPFERERGMGRPTKRDRRLLDRLRSGELD